MSCPICGPICHCDNKTENKGAAEQVEQASRWPDPEAYDASEEQFAASLEATSVASGTEVVPVETQIETLATELSEPSIFQAYEDPAAWKQELAEK